MLFFEQSIYNPETYLKKFHVLLFLNCIKKVIFKFNERTGDFKLFDIDLALKNLDLTKEQFRRLKISNFLN